MRQQACFRLMDLHPLGKNLILIMLGEKINNKKDPHHKTFFQKRKKTWTTKFK
jgi:hypothetical protein